MKLKNLLFAGILSLVFGLSASSVFAVNNSKSLSSLKRQTVARSYFATKAAAERSVSSATRRGYQARTYYSGSMRKWVVEINYLGSTANNNRRNTSGNTSGNANGSAIGEGCETALRSAEILYFPSQSMAQDIYKAHLRQGDCAKIWNAGSKGWAVAVKAITGRGLRPNRPSQNVITRPGGRLN